MYPEYLIRARTSHVLVLVLSVSCTFDPLSAAPRGDAAADTGVDRSDAGSPFDADDTRDAADEDATPLDAIIPDMDADAADAPPIPNVCGDGLIIAPETCDDGNVAAGDGCEDCAITAGYLCVRAPSVCVRESDTTLVDSSTVACSPDMGCGSVAQPCCTLASAIAEMQPYVLMLGDRIYRGSVSIGAGRRVEIIADKAAVLEGVGAEAIEIHAGADVTVRGLTIIGAGSAVLVSQANTRATFFDCAIGPSGGLGFDIKDGTTIRLERNVVSDNATGGIKIDTDAAPYRLANNVIFENGAAATEFGAIFLKRATLGSVLANNTITRNRVGGNAQATAAGGVRCDAIGALIINSIIWENELAPGVPSTVSHDCNVRYSDVGPVNTTTSADNFSADPMFIAGTQFRIALTSTCVDRGDPAHAPADDIDGDVRPIGAGIDVGADESG